MKLILVGLDESARAADVLHTARRLSETTGAKLVLMHAVSLPPGIPPEYYSFPPEKLPELLQQDARKVLEGRAAELPPDMVAGIRATVGTAWQELCRVAHQERVDLIIIGSHGYGAIDRVLGTTAGKVVNHADCSVLVVRPPRP